MPNRIETPGGRISAGMRDHSGGQASSSVSSSASSTSKDMRGSHPRTTEQKGYAQVAYEHFELVEQHLLGKPCLSSCPYNKQCGLMFNPNDHLSAHYSMYGTATMMKYTSNGEKVYECKVPFQQVLEKRKEIVRAAIMFDADGKRTEQFKVNGKGPVCPEFCRASYGIPNGAWLKLLALGRKGTLDSGFAVMMMTSLWKVILLVTQQSWRLLNGGKRGYSWRIKCQTSLRLFIVPAFGNSFTKTSTNLT